MSDCFLRRMHSFLSNAHLNDKERCVMKRNNNYLLLLALLLIVVAALALWGCENGESANANYTPEDFVSLDNFTLRTNTKKNSVMRYDKSEEGLFYSSTYIGEGHTNTVYYAFEKDRNREYSEGAWKDVEDSDRDKYVDSIENACGLIYNKLDPTQFEEIKGKKLKFGVEPHAFFKQAYRQIYQNYFGTDYDEKTFDEDFEQNAPTLFGDMDDFEIILDCSQSDRLVLEIKNDRDGFIFCYGTTNLVRSTMDCNSLRLCVSSIVLRIDSVILSAYIITLLSALRAARPAV